MCVGVEVGVWCGLNAADMLIRWKNLRMLHLVDWYRRPGSKEARAYAEYILKPFRDRITWHNMSSKLASEKFKKESLDFIYIDAGHDYHSVERDLFYWYDKCRKGGVFSGHDFCIPPARDNANRVYEAVLDYLVGKKKYKEITTLGTPDWWVVKK